MTVGELSEFIILHGYTPGGYPSSTWSAVMTDLLAYSAPYRATQPWKDAYQNATNAYHAAVASEAAAAAPPPVTPPAAPTADQIVDRLLSTGTYPTDVSAETWLSVIDKLQAYSAPYKATQPWKDAWQLATNVYYQITGLSYTTRGIPPDWTIQTLFAQMAQGMVDGIVAGLVWLKEQLAYLRGELTKALVNAMADPMSASLTIVGVLLVTIALQVLYDTLKKNAIFMAISTFLLKVGDIVTTLTQTLHLDAILVLASLSDAFIETFHNSLLPIYKAFSDLAAELERDTSFITVFAETNRALLYAAYSFVPNGEIKAELEYARGMANWLGGIKEKLGDYIANPESIFLDMGLAIASTRTEEEGKTAANLWAGIDASANWIRDKGEVLIGLVADLDRIQKDLPQEVQDAIAVWFLPLQKRLDDFIIQRWNPFFARYNNFASVVTGYFAATGLDIKRIQAKLRNPVDFLYLLFGLPDAEKKASLSHLNDLNRLASQGDNGPSIESIGPMIAPMLDPLAFMPYPLPVPPGEPEAVQAASTIPIEQIRLYSNPWSIPMIGEHHAKGANASWYVGEN